MEFEDLHDATLKSIVICWESGEVVLSLAMGGPAWDRPRIVATGTVSFTCTREEPWGHSVSVNSATIVPIETSCGTKQRVRIEMQSGDLIEIVADDIRFEK